MYPLVSSQSSLAQMSASFSQPLAFADFGSSYLTGVLVLTTAAKIVLTLAVTIGIRQDAVRLREAGVGTLFFGPFGWPVVAFCVSLLGSVAGALAIIAIYWLIHYSTFRRH